MNKKSQNRGFGGVVTIVIVGILALAYLNVDLRGIVHNTPIIQKALNIFVVAWTNYVAPLGKYLWASISGLLK